MTPIFFLFSLAVLAPSAATQSGKLLCRCTLTLLFRCRLASGGTLLVLVPFVLFLLGLLLALTTEVGSWKHDDVNLHTSSPV